MKQNNHLINQKELKSQNATVLKFLNILMGFSCIFAYVNNIIKPNVYTLQQKRILLQRQTVNTMSRNQRKKFCAILLLAIETDTLEP